MSFLDKISGLEKDTFGLDIGYENLKVVQLKKAGSLFKLVGFGSLPSPKNPFSKNTIADKNELASAIKKAASDYHLRAKGVISALPESVVFTKIIQATKMKPRELETSVPLEAASFLPIDPAQTYLDFQIVGESQEKYEILIVAAPKTLVDDFIETFKIAGLSLVCLETKPLANARALIAETAREVFLILDLGAQATSLTILAAGAIKFTATVPVGGNLFTEKIAAALSISPEKAEEKKRSMGITKGEQKIKQAISDPLNSLIDEIISGLKYYQGHNQGSTVSKIILAGGGANLPGLVSFIEEKTNLKTELGNPWKPIKDPHLKTGESLQYTAAIGLAMRQL